MPNPPTPGQVCYEAFIGVQRTGQPPRPPTPYGRLQEVTRAAWEAAAQAVQPRLTAWERTWLADLGRTAPWTAAEREIWCLLLEKYFGDHALAQAIYDRQPLPTEDPPHA